MKPVDKLKTYCSGDMVYYFGMTSYIAMEVLISVAFHQSKRMYIVETDDIFEPT